LSKGKITFPWLNRGDLTAPPGRMYIAGVGKRRDSWAGAAIYRAAKKAISYQEDLMPILIRHPDNKITLPGEAEITAFRPEMMPFLLASYTAINAIFGVLHGSI